MIGLVMTNWQWRVVMALVRYVLYKEDRFDFGQEMNNRYEESLKEDDLMILNEAVIRDE